MFRVPPGIVAIAAAVAGIGYFEPNAAAAPPQPTILTGYGGKHPFATRPARIAYTLDSSGFVGGTDGTDVLPHHLGKIKWSSYTSRQAIGRGLVWLDSGPRFVALPVRLHAFSPADGHFRRLTLQFKLHGKQYADRRIVRFSPGGRGYHSRWYYAIAHNSEGP